jgi:hypothetical protein
MTWLGCSLLAALALILSDVPIPRLLLHSLLI